ncbi:concanavalin A-like lectin/glucanase domain-containing protein [Echria macrotheca]|uniref:Concanavalin A-like lectin/glucanase domain-containing protein n=1 Tax=Echria macrotheca TaxID=438768 RepID=A0AAJ0B3B7_9PEZI|nr:concanavalin A-like lectin/glucanase domain-containing protein [Echria macrotheca]
MHPLLLAIAAATAASAKLVLFLPLNETAGTQATDYSGNNRHGRYINTPALQGRNGTRLDGVDGCIQLPNDLMRNQYTLSASIEVLIRTEQSGNYFVFGLGNAGSNGYGNGYVFVTGDPVLRGAITPSTYDNEAEVRTGSALARNVWTTLTFVVDSTAQGGGRLTLYQDGRSLGGRTNNAAIVAPGSIGTGSTSSNYIGRSTFKADKYLAGSVRNFRLWDHALSAAEVATLVPPTQAPGTGGGGGDSGTSAEDRITAALLALNIPNVDAIRGNIVLPTVSNGIPINWSSSQPEVISTNGTVIRYDQDVLVALTATANFDGASGQRTFFAMVLRAGA